MKRLQWLVTFLTEPKGSPQGQHELTSLSLTRPEVGKPLTKVGHCLWSGYHRRPLKLTLLGNAPGPWFYRVYCQQKYSASPLISLTSPPLRLEIGIAFVLLLKYWWQHKGQTNRLLFPLPCHKCPNFLLQHRCYKYVLFFVVNICLLCGRRAWQPGAVHTLHPPQAGSPRISGAHHSQDSQDQAPKP